MGWFFLFGLIVGVPVGHLVGRRVTWFYGYLWGFAYFGYLLVAGWVTNGRWSDWQWNVLAIFPGGLVMSAFWSSASGSDNPL